MQAAERFGAVWTGTADHDRDGYPDEITPGDVTALVAFQAALPPPGQAAPDDPARLAAAAEGERLFGAIGCAAFYRSALPLESLRFADPGPLDTAGTLTSAGSAGAFTLDLGAGTWAADLGRDDQGRVLVPLFSDLNRHRIPDDESDHFANELLSQRFVGREEFLTPRLWGAGDSAPYGHRGDVTTLSAAILHHGGEARAARGAFAGLADADRRAVVEFLKSLRLPSAL